MLSRLDPLLEEFIVAAMAMTVLGVLVALAFWGLTDISPWPMVILSEVAGFGFGTALLALGSPRRSR
ncbi:MAG: hypothetical protein FJ039_07285 [Chloroflexi bacterium]|nr:hypothetical protein [Chloroflexota bacterium]